MSTAVATSDSLPEPAAPGAVNTESFVEASADELIVGRSVTRPIYDLQGMLLLADGMTITPEFKRLLRERHLGSVRLHAEDVDRITIRGVQRSDEDQRLVDDALATRLDEVIDSGLLFVVNSEKAVLDRMAVLGCKSYDQVKHRELIERNQETSVFVDNLMQNALRGKQVDGGEVMRLTAQYLGDMTEDADSVLASVLETVKQRSIAGRCVNVALLAMGVGIEMGLDAPNVRNLGVAALVHDWGMAQVRPEILQSDRRLTDDEFFEIKKHPIASLRLLERLPGIPSVVPLIAYQVHERPNGNGYPRGRTGERIHPLAKIISVADVYEALITPRPFRPPLMRYAAMECALRLASAGDLDSNTVRALLRVQSLFPIGSYVSLSDGSVARVLRRNGDKYLRPIVRLVQDSQGRGVAPADEGGIVDLDQAGLDVREPLPTPGRQEIALSPETLEPRMYGERAGQEAAPADAPSRLFATPGTGLRSPAAEAMPSLESYTERQRRQVESALAFLDRTGEAEGKKYQESRKLGDRNRLRSVVQICIPRPGSQVLDLQGPGAFRAIARDISRGGLSFVHPAQLAVRHLIVGVQIGDEAVRWFHAEVVRCRPIVDSEFWEYGVAFRSRFVA